MMDLAGILFAFAILLVLASFVAQPFVRGVPDRAPASDLEGLWTEKDRLIGLLQDLEQDLALAKVDRESYDVQRAELTRRAAYVIHDIEGHAPLEGKRATRCPACGRPTRPQDRFCSNCGGPLVDAG